MKRQKRSVGSIVKIDLKNGYNAYARVLDKANYAVYDFITKEDIIDIKAIISKPVLFIIAGYDEIITKCKWLEIGNIALEDNLKVLPMKFIQDKLNPTKFELYDPNTGLTKLTTKEECIWLERAAVWKAEHIEERIRDYIEGKPNFWFESMKPL